MISPAMLFKYSSYGEVPEFVKASEPIDDAQLASLPPTAFADNKRQYPIHSKTAAWLSALKMYNNDLNDATEENIIKAASFWGIQDELHKMSENFKTANSRPALDDTDFAVIVKSAEETIERRFKLTDAESIREAAEGLENNKNRYPLGIRKEAAKRILAAASNHKVSLNNQDYLEKSAGYGVSRVSEVKRALIGRRHQARKSAAFTDIIEELGKSDTSILKGELQEKVAEAIDTFDRKTGVYRYYGNGILTPEEVCYAQNLSKLEKSASTKMELRDGTKVDMGDLMGKISNFKATKFAALGDDFVDSISDEEGNIDKEAFMAIVPTLPIDDTSILKRSL